MALSVPAAWRRLGIAPTTDRAAIRRAYAARLKDVHPEDDPAGFQALRAAYELALAHADRAARFVVIQAESEASGVREADTDEPDRTSTEDPPRPARFPNRAWVERAPEAPPVVPLPPEPPAWVREAEAEEAAFQAACSHLARLIADRKTPSAVLVQALSDLIDEPALQSIARHGRAEAWLAELILREAPRADPLMDMAVERFGWDSVRLTKGRNVGQAVVARRDDLRFIKSPQPGAAYHLAYEALKAPMRRRAFWTARLSPEMPGQVRGLLALIRTERPGLMAGLDPETVAWWDAYFSRPRFGPVSVWVAIALPALLGLLTLSPSAKVPRGHSDLASAAIVYGLSLAGVLCVLLARLFAIEWPRHIWRRRWSQDAPAVLRLGWAPGAVALVAAAALIPPSPGAVAGLDVAAVLLALWAIVTGQPDRSPPTGRGWAWPGGRLSILGAAFAAVLYLTQMLWRPGMRYPWRVRSLFAFAYMAVFWLLIDPGAESGRGGAFAAWPQMGLPVAAACVAFVAGAQSLIDAWFEQGWRLWRRTLLGFLAVATPTAAGLMWMAWRLEAYRAPAVGLTAILVVLQKIPGARLQGRPFLWRDVVMRYGWMGWVIAFDNLHGGAKAMTVGGLWLLTGVAVTTGIAIATEFGVRIPALKRPGRP